MEIFLIGFLAGLVFGYGMGLLTDRWDKKIKNDR
jgi:capsular polysaccharide biosynthesis protein